MSLLYWSISSALRRAYRNAPVQVSKRALRVTTLSAKMANPVQPTVSDPPTANFVIGVTKPDASNTGVPSGTALSDYSGEMTITTAGTVVENRRVFGRILVRAANVTIRNCEIVGVWPDGRTGSGGIIDCNHPSASNVLIERCTLRCNVPSLPLGTGILGHDYTARRCHVYNVTDYFGVYNNNDPYKQGPTNVVIEGCYGHDFSFISPEPGQSDNRTHNDGVQIQGGTGTIIRGNTLIALSSDTFGSGGSKDVPAPNPYHPYWGSIIVFTPNVSQISGVLIEKNWLYGGYRGIGVARNKFDATSVGIIRNNIFGRDRAVYSLGGVYGTKDIMFQNTMSADNVSGIDTMFDDPNGNVYEDGSPVTVQFRSSV